MNTLFVPEAKYREIDKKNSCSSIAEKGICQTFFWQNVEYVAHSAMGTGNGRGWACIWGHQVVDVSTYSGTLKPLKKGDHQREVDTGRRERGYAGMLLTTGKRQVVIVGSEITFKQADTGQQLSIF